MENRRIVEAKKSSSDSKLAEIEKQGRLVTMEAKIEALGEMIEAKNQRLTLVNEDENLSELIDKKKVKEMQREIKLLEKQKSKLEKMYEKACGSKRKEVLDETDDVEFESNIDQIVKKFIDSGKRDEVLDLVNDSKQESDNEGRWMDTRDDAIFDYLKSIGEDPNNEELFMAMTEVVPIEFGVNEAMIADEEELMTPNEEAGEAVEDESASGAFEESVNEEFSRFKKLAGL